MSDRFKAFVIALKKRCPPWEFRAAARLFFVSSSFSHQITACFDVNHVKKTIVIRYVLDLPGQE